MRTLNFTVDAALLRELGERLVGQPHIALAELIKNAYDADATKVVVRFLPDTIEIVDNGHGMDAETFERYWMRIGSPHKAAVRQSARFHRPLTGSKGVGRLAAQFLASHIEVATRSDPRSNVLLARVNWERAVRAPELTHATAQVNDNAPNEAFAGDSTTGTRLTLTDLHQTWDANALRELARELWPLQPPFGRSASGEPTAGDFEIELSTEDREAQSEFEDQMGAILTLWSARIRGEMVTDEDADTGRSDHSEATRHVAVVVEFDDGSRETMDARLPLQSLEHVGFEIRVFNLRYRQRYGIFVREAREYLRNFGGVHIYDAGFHLPYYGPGTDWLDTERDHARRITRSELLPERFQVAGGMEYLPPNPRLYGVVEVDTGYERAAAVDHGRSVRDALTIQVSRDRLVSNAAFAELKTVVRAAVDFYATRAAARAHRATDDRGPAGTVLQRTAHDFTELVETLGDELPAETRQKLVEGVKRIDLAIETEAQGIARQAGLLGALATAGISAVAYEHEATRQLQELDRLRRRLARQDSPEARALATDLKAWIERAKATRRIFSPLLDEANRDEIHALRARAVLEHVEEQTRFLLRGVRCDFSRVDEGVRLPPGRYAEWSALWQNVFVNAGNAMLDSAERRLEAISMARGSRRAVVLMDTGTGVDLDEAERYFEPFERRQQLSPERRGLGVGGTGLGLTIVRMLARNLRCDARFIEPPDEDFATAFELSWRTT